jgi:hypothetical protein
MYDYKKSGSTSIHMKRSAKEILKSQSAERQSFQNCLPQRIQDENRFTVIHTQWHSLPKMPLFPSAYTHPEPYRDSLGFILSLSLLGLFNLPLSVSRSLTGKEVLFLIARIQHRAPPPPGVPLTVVKQAINILRNLERNSSTCSLHLVRQ